MPNLVGMKLVDAIKAAINAGLNIRLAGMGAISPSAASPVSEQSLPPGVIVKRGSVIIIRAITNDFKD